LDLSVRPCGRARGVAGVGVVYHLAPKKCMWYIISHRWKDGKPRLISMVH
jgi:hypothetical protein